MKEKRMCLLDEKKVCDDCGECDRCDLDPNKICDNCCRCIAMEDEGKEFRSRTIIADNAMHRHEPAVKKTAPKKKAAVTDYSRDITDEPLELTPELVEYWENKLLEYGEAPADDGLGEIEVSVKNPVYGRRPVGPHRKKHS